MRFILLIVVISVMVFMTACSSEQGLPPPTIVETTSENNVLNFSDNASVTTTLRKGEKENFEISYTNDEGYPIYNFYFELVNCTDEQGDLMVQEPEFYSPKSGVVFTNDSVAHNVVLSLEDESKYWRLEEGSYSCKVVAIGDVKRVQRMKQLEEKTLSFEIVE